MCEPKCSLLYVLVLFQLIFTSSASEPDRWCLLTGDPRVSSISEGDENYWIGTRVGLSRVSKTGGEPVIYHHSNSSLPSDGISHVCRNVSSGDLWVGTAYGPRRFDGYTFHRPAGIPESTYAEIGAMALDSSGRVWVAWRNDGRASEGLGVLGYLDTNEIYHDVLLEFPGFPSALTNAPIVHIECDTSGGVWVSAVGRHEEALVYLRNGEWNRYVQRIGDITLDRMGRLWMHGYRDRINRTMSLGYIEPGGAPQWLDSGQVPFNTSEVLGLCAGPRGEGVLVQTKFGFYLNSEQGWDHLPVALNGRGSAVCMSDGAVWYFTGKDNPFYSRVMKVAEAELHRIVDGGTPERVMLWPHETEQTQFFDIVSGYGNSVWSSGSCLTRYQAFTSECLTAPERIRQLSGSPDGTVYAQYHEGIVSRIRAYNSNGYHDHPVRDDSYIVSDFAFDSWGRAHFAVCTRDFDRLYAVCFVDSTLQYLDSIPLSGRIQLNQKAAISGDSVLSFQSSRRILSFDMQGQSWAQYVSVNTDMGPRNAFHGLVGDSGGVAWVGSLNGVIRMNFATDVHHVIGAADSGESSTVVYCKGIDKSVWGTVSFGGTGHPMRIRNDSMTVFRSKKDPLLHKTIAATVDTQGNVWYATESGIVVFNPDGLSESLVKNSYAPTPDRSPAFSDRIRVSPVRGSRIRAFLPVGGRVTCRIFDSRGRTLSQMNHGRLASGTHTLNLFSQLRRERAVSLLFVRFEVTGLNGDRIVEVVRVPAKRW